MKLTCPECGAHGSATMFASDATARQTLALSLNLPAPIQADLESYIALFRPQKRGLSWGKIKRIVVELDKLVKADRLTWNHQPPVKCPPRVWAEAMQVVIDGDITRPLKNHNYLRAVAYDLAVKYTSKVDAQAERETEASRRAGKHRKKERGDGSSWTPDQKPESKTIPEPARKALEKLNFLDPKEKKSGQS